MADDQTGVASDAAGSRLERLGRAGAWGSLLSAQEFAAIASAGFDPVGNVLGTAVVHLGFGSQASRCSGTPSYTPRTDLASAASGPFNTMLRQRYGVRRLVLSRAVEECVALGGDGIVGLALTIRLFPAGGTEFTIQGTAVRARSGIRPAVPFTSHVSGQEFAALLRSGWVPAALVFGVSLGARHDDKLATSQTRLSAGNTEVRSYSALVKDTRRDARDQLEQVVADLGADGIVVDELTLQIGERECPTVEGGHDHTAEVSILGTSIVAFDRSSIAAGRPPLTIMRVNPSPAVPTGLRPVRPVEPSEPTVPDSGVLDRYLTAWAAKRAATGVYSARDSAAISRKTD
jgi:uncharacterized protein YbjQ (UPF0145 family)